MQAETSWIAHCCVSRYLHTCTNTCSTDPSYPCSDKGTNSKTNSNTNIDAHKIANAPPNDFPDTYADATSVLRGRMGYVAFVLARLRWRFAGAN